METFMIFLIVILFIIPLVFVADDDEQRNSNISWRLLISAICLYVAVILIVLSIQNSSYKYLTNHPNPYHKEYVYHQKPDGTMIKVDSIYVKTKQPKK